MRYCRLLDKGVRGLRIGFVRHFHETDMPADADVGAALEEVVRVLEGEGANVIDVSLPPLATFAGTNGVIVRSESWTCYAHLLRTRPQDFSQLSRQRLMTGAFLSAEDYVQALHNRLKLIAAVEAVFSDVDILLSASSMHTASRIDDPAETTRTYFRQARTPFNLTGHPAISMLSGFSEQGLPLSAQFVGKYFGEAELFRVAAAYERAAGWNKRHPTIAALTRNAA
jgi:aspartyl-tRNA(Asn)/glutamyl-tRNA(Gln) amidotransferase subunit A